MIDSMPRIKNIKFSPKRGAIFVTVIGIIATIFSREIWLEGKHTENLTGKMLLNRYLVDEFIGRGGMAEVYKVWDLQRSTYLAMKVLHQDLARRD